MTSDINNQDRKLGRELALQLLFQREFAEVLAAQSWPDLFEKSLSPGITDFTQSLITGVTEQLSEIDKIVQSAARNWKIERMSHVDRNVLRIGTFEMLFQTEPTPAPVVINEAVELAKKYGSTDSGGFVNGVLDQISKQKAWSRVDS